jgi:hypothetical protein
LKQKPGGADIELKTAADITCHATLRQGEHTQEIAAARCRSAEGRKMIADHDGNDGSMSALMRLVARFRAWRRRRVARRHSSLMGLSDRCWPIPGCAGRTSRRGGRGGCAACAARLSAAADVKHQLPRRRMMTVVAND